MWRQLTVSACDNCHVQFGPTALHSFLRLQLPDAKEDDTVFWFHFCSYECVQAWKTEHREPAAPIHAVK